VFFFQEVLCTASVLDTTFNTDDDGLQGDGFDSTVRTLALQSDGSLVGGDYLYFNGTSLPYLSRLKPTVQSMLHST
jgi:hypothetical protein